MARVCLKCNYERTPNKLAPETECPQCGAIYAKIEKALRPPEAVPPPGAASQTPESSEQKMVELTANNHLNVFSLFIACF